MITAVAGASATANTNASASASVNVNASACASSPLPLESLSSVRTFLILHNYPYSFLDVEAEAIRPQQGLPNQVTWRHLPVFWLDRSRREAASRYRRYRQTLQMCR